MNYGTLDQILIMLTPLGLLPGGRHTNTRDVSFLYALLYFRNLKCEPGLFIQINKGTNSGSYGPEKKDKHKRNGCVICSSQCLEGAQNQKLTFGLKSGLTIPVH